MAKDPWTDPDPQPGDFDACLADVDPKYVETHKGVPDSKLTMLIGIDYQDAKRLEELAAARGQRPRDVISSLLRRT
jgi:hypothetical protein